MGIYCDPKSIISDIYSLSVQIRVLSSFIYTYNNVHIFLTSEGIIKGDEIMVINGAIVSDLDMMYLESVLQEELSLCTMMRSSRTEPPDLAGLMRATDDIIDSLVCPPPPSDPPIISEEMISGLIVPAPGWSKFAPQICIIISSKNQPFCFFRDIWGKLMGKYLAGQSWLY